MPPFELWWMILGVGVGIYVMVWFITTQFVEDVILLKKMFKEWREKRKKGTLEVLEDETDLSAK